LGKAGAAIHPPNGRSRPLKTSGRLRASNRTTQLKADDRAEARRLLRLQEEERRRLSLELHHAIVHTLAALSANLDLIERHAAALNPRARSVLAESRFIARQCFLDARKFTDELRPPLVGEVGLTLALRCHVASFTERTGVAVDLSIEGDGRLPAEIEMTLFRLVEDCLNDLRRPLASGAPVVRVTTGSDVATLAIEPVRLETALHWRRHCRLQFGDAVDVRFTTLPAPEGKPGESEPGVGLVLTVPSAIVDGR